MQCGRGLGLTSFIASAHLTKRPPVRGGRGPVIASPLENGRGNNADIMLSRGPPLPMKGLVNPYEVDGGRGRLPPKRGPPVRG